MVQTSSAILVTGASTGIGEACALAMAQRGYRVYAGVRREMDGMALQEKHPAIMPLLLDVTEAASITSAVDVLTDAVGEQGLAGLVNNAGVYVPGPLETLPLDALRRQVDVNLMAPMAVTQALIPLLRKAQGRIVNIGSMAGRRTFPFAAAYCASKYGLEAVTDALRMELHPWGIRVSVVEPGVVATPAFWQKSVQHTETFQNLPGETFELYGEKLRVLERNIARREQWGMPVERAVDAVVHALTAKKPKNRYLIGWDAKAAVWGLRLLPEWLRDRILLNNY
jgi:NAD(P)-dependent dehydrogenase (short-subunit alcohol dehydrogenase family)